MSHTQEELVKHSTDEFDETTISQEISRLSIRICEEKRLVQQSKEMSRSSSQVHPTWHPKAFIVHILVMTFGTSAWIGVNGIFIQLPVLVNYLPESWGLAAYLVIVIQAANVVPVVYTLLRKSSCGINESPCILLMLIITSVAMGLLAFLYNKTSYIGGKEHSTALFALTFFTAAVSCTSSVLFMPYLRNFKEIYLVSYFIGEGLSGVVPSIVALIQGIDGSHTCNSTANSIQATDTATSRFSPFYYFLFLFTCLIMSLIAFIFLEKLPFVKIEKISSQKSDSNSSSNETQNCRYENQIPVLSTGSTLKDNRIDRQIYVDKYEKTDIEGISNFHFTLNDRRLSFEIFYLLFLLGIICLLANGFLPGLQPYSCLSYGNITYHLSATFSQIANPTACFLALWFLPKNTKLINGLSVTILIISSFVIYLATASPNPPFQSTRFGDILVILSWVLLMAFISYVKLIITSVFRRKSEKSLFFVGVVMQTGSACGAVLSFILINYTSLLNEYDPCSNSEN